MKLTALQHQLIEELRNGLPICSHPYRTLADSIGASEADVMNALHQLMQDGLINRFGAILRHRALGYQANAMCVFDIPDQDARDVGKRMAALSYVTLCYQRERVPGIWPFNLYCMIHGREKMIVRAQIRHMVAQLGLTDVPQKVLFSKRCFAQHAGKYSLSPTSRVIPAGEQHEPA